MKGYIRGIDGLRAIAVLAVLVFHAFPKVLPGGFIGVDVFFVISGYIITKTYFAELADGELTLRTFFAKRVRRLAPIYVVVLLVTTAAAYAILTPIHLRHFAESLVAQPLYLQNLVFWHHGDYFEQALSKPLLHTWSLAVEEQFYLSYAVLVLVARRSRKVALALTALVVVGSLAMGFKLYTISPKTVFYMLPPRFWELGMGVLLAAFLARAPRKVLPFADVVGLGLVVWSIVGFDEHARLPGTQSLAACVGTALVLAAVAGDEGPMLPVLASRPMVYVGKLSYSLYLWHWPILALASSHLERPLRPLEAGAAIAATFVLAHFGYEYVERPVRERRVLVQTRQLLGAAALSGVVTASVAVVFVKTDGATFRYPPAVARLYLAQQQRSPFRCPSLGRLADPRSEVCKINAASADGNVLVLGDSHADVLDEVVGELAARSGRGAFLTKRDCKLYDFGRTPTCGDSVLEQIEHDIEANRIKYVVSMAFFQPDFAEERELAATVERLLRLVDRVFIMQVVPNDPSFHPEGRARALRSGAPAAPPYRLEAYRTANARHLGALERLAAANPRVTVLDPTRYLCAGEVCEVDTDGTPNYFDAHHLSPTGARRLSPMFAAVLASLGREARTE